MNYGFVRKDSNYQLILINYCNYATLRLGNDGATCILLNLSTIYNISYE